MKKTKADERYWIMKNVKLNKRIYFKDILTSKWRSENNVRGEVILCFHGGGRDTTGFLQNI